MIIKEFSNIMNNKKSALYGLILASIFTPDSFAGINQDSHKRLSPSISGQPPEIEYSTVISNAEYSTNNEELEFLSQSQPGTVATESTSLFVPYGFILPNVSYASHAIDSLGHTNQVAPTAASSAINPQDPLSRMTFQVQQSRIGLKINPDESLRGKFEVDFVDFSKPSPVQQAVPRLRIAKVEYLPTDQTTVFFGQDWDVFSPLNPHTFNFVGNYFEAGNAGFMRQQVGVTHQCSSLEGTVALGLPGYNATPTDSTPIDSNLELSLVPTAAGRISYVFDKNRVGVSAIASRLTFNNARDIQRGVWGLNAFLDLTPIDSFNLKAEGYWGQNLANTGTLSLSQGTLAATMKEVGAYVSARYVFTENNALFGGFGFAKITNSGQLAYNVQGGSSLGIKSNTLFKLGLEQRLVQKLTLFLEGTFYHTLYQQIQGGTPSGFTAVTVASGFHMPF